MSDLVYGLPLWIADTNCWVIRSATSSQECVLIDVPPDTPKLVKFLHERSLRPVAVIATHGHIDHIGGIPGLVEQPEYLDEEGHQQLPVHLHPGDRHMLRDPIKAAGQFGQMIIEAGISTKEPELIHDIDDGGKIGGAGLSFRAIHTPGHTKGSTCFEAEVEGLGKILFSGDHLFKGSIGRTDLPGGSMEELMASMEKSILPMSDEVVVLPGHGEATTIGEEKRANPFLTQLRR